MSRGESSELNIGYVSNLHYGLLPATLGAFRKLYPCVALNLFDMTSAEQLHALAARKLDLGFVASPLGKTGDSEHGARKIDLGFVGLRPELSGHDLLSDCVAFDTILAALPTHHPLAKKAKVKLADLGAAVLHQHLRKSPSGRASVAARNLSEREIHGENSATSRHRTDHDQVRRRRSGRGSGARANYQAAARRGWSFARSRRRATLPQFEPVRSASGLSTPHPSRNPKGFRNAFPTRLRRRNCAPPPSQHRFARVLAHGDPSAPLLPSLPAFGLPLRAGRRRRIADEAPPRLPHPRAAPTSWHASCCHHRPKDWQPVLSLQGIIGGGFPPAALLRSSSLSLAPAHSAPGLEGGGKGARSAEISAVVDLFTWRCH
jgi:hypothetical protein